MARLQYALGLKVAEKLGLDPNTIRKITITSEVSKAEMVTVEFLPDEDMAPLIEEFYLVKEGYGIPLKAEALNG